MNAKVIKSVSFIAVCLMLPLAAVGAEPAPAIGETKLSNVVIASFPSGVRAEFTLLPGETFATSREGEVNIIEIRAIATGETVRRYESTSPEVPAWSVGVATAAVEGAVAAGGDLTAMNEGCSTFLQTTSGGRYCASVNAGTLVYHQMSLYAADAGRYRLYAYWKVPGSSTENWQALLTVTIPGAYLPVGSDSWHSSCKAYTVSGSGLDVRSRTQYERLDSNGNVVQTSSAWSSYVRRTASSGC